MRTFAEIQQFRTVVILLNQPPTFFKSVVIGGHIAHAHQKLLTAPIGGRTRIGAHPNFNDRQRNASFRFLDSCTRRLIGERSDWPEHNHMIGQIQSARTIGSRLRTDADNMSLCRNVQQKRLMRPLRLFVACRGAGRPASLNHEL
jgi:hypothetical protein